IDQFEKDPKKIASARQGFSKYWSCAIVGGPAVVRLPFERGADTHSIFVAVSKGPAQHLGGYVSDCVLYEFNDHGQPVSIVKLTQMVRGAKFRVRKDGVVWKCQNEAYFKAAISHHTGNFGGGPGGPDLLTRIPWFRQLTPVERTAALVADKSGDPAAFG